MSLSYKERRAVYSKKDRKNHSKRISIQKKRWYASNKSWLNKEAWGRSLKRKFNLSVEQYFILFKQQRGRCALCKKVSESRRLAVDHNHITKRVRGLLCFSCNYRTGWFCDNTLLFKRMVTYFMR